MKPFLKWPGGKQTILKYILEYVPNKFNLYYEPFLGGGALYFKLAQLRAANQINFNYSMLSDINPELMNTYSAVKYYYKNLSVCLRKMSKDYKNRIASNTCQEMYLETREAYNQSLNRLPENNVQKAAQFIFLNHTCFNGLYRVNQKGEFNVPFGKYKAPRVYNPKVLNDARIALFNTTLQTGPYLLAETAKKGDFVYLDPPYFPIKKESFTQYAAVWGVKEHEDLCAFFTELNSRGVAVVLSNSDTAEVRKLYKAFRYVEIQQNRSIGGGKSSRNAKRDLLILSDSI